MCCVFVLAQGLCLSSVLRWLGLEEMAMSAIDEADSRRMLFEAVPQLTMETHRFLVRYLEEV
jgi:hypothetical protein